MTSSEAKAVAAIDSLVVERDAAKGRLTFYKNEAENAKIERDNIQRQARAVEARAEAAEKEVAELRNRLYGRTARALTGFFECSREYVPSQMADHIRIAPRSANLMLARDAVFSAVQPLTVINDAIKRVVEMHARELTENLRGAVWPR